MCRAQYQASQEVEQKSIQLYHICICFPQMLNACSTILGKSHDCYNNLKVFPKVLNIWSSYVYLHNPKILLEKNYSTTVCIHSLKPIILNNNNWDLVRNFHHSCSNILGKTGITFSTFVKFFLRFSTLGAIMFKFTILRFS